MKPHKPAARFKVLAVPVDGMLHGGQITLGGNFERWLSRCEDERVQNRWHGQRGQQSADRRVVDRGKVLPEEALGSMISLLVSTIFLKANPTQSYRLILTRSYHGGTPVSNSSSLTDLVSPSLSKSSRYLSLEDIFKQLASWTTRVELLCLKLQRLVNVFYA